MNGTKASFRVGTTQDGFTLTAKTAGSAANDIDFEVVVGSDPAQGSATARYDTGGKKIIVTTGFGDATITLGEIRTALNASTSVKAVVDIGTLDAGDVNKPYLLGVGGGGFTPTTLIGTADAGFYLQQKQGVSDVWAVIYKDGSGASWGFALDNTNKILTITEPNSNNNPQALYNALNGNNAIKALFDIKADNIIGNHNAAISNGYSVGKAINPTSSTDATTGNFAGGADNVYHNVIGFYDLGRSVMTAIYKGTKTTKIEFTLQHDSSLSANSATAEIISGTDNLLVKFNGTAVKLNDIYNALNVTAITNLYTISNTSVGANDVFERLSLRINNTQWPANLRQDISGFTSSRTWEAKANESAFYRIGTASEGFDIRVKTAGTSGNVWDFDLVIGNRSNSQTALEAVYSRPQKKITLYTGTSDQSITLKEIRDELNSVGRYSCFLRA